MKSNCSAGSLLSQQKWNGLFSCSQQHLFGLELLSDSVWFFDQRESADSSGLHNQMAFSHALPVKPAHDCFIKNLKKSKQEERWAVTISCYLENTGKLLMFICCSCLPSCGLRCALHSIKYVASYSFLQHHTYDNIKPKSNSWFRFLVTQFDWELILLSFLSTELHYET